MKILISAGPTREPIDKVRFITNASSGRMGLALAEAAAGKGHEVTLVLGPVACKPKLKRVKVVDVCTAAEMADVVLKELGGGVDVFISAAAVADYTPEKVFMKKIKSGKIVVLKLKPTEKITALAKKKFPKVFVVAFKAEFDVSKKVLVDRAFSKLNGENLDLIIANDIERNRMGSSETDAYIIDKKGKVSYLKNNGKKVIAERIVSFIASCLEQEPA